MSSTSKAQEAFPAVPSSLNAGDHEMRGYSADYSDYPPTTIPKYTPYLGLRARLSQIVINKWTILLLLVLARVLIAVKDLDHNIASAKTEALSACTSVENVGSAMASMPHYLSKGVNALAADGVTKAVNGLMDMLLLTVTGIEALIVFIINMYISTYVCLIQLVISGSLHVAIQLIEETAKTINQSISSITSSISSDVTSFEGSINTFLSGIGGVLGALGTNKKPPTLDLSSQLSSLSNIKVDPTKLDADLTNLNNNIPTFEQVQNFTNNLIKFPFEELKKLINESLVAYKFDDSVFPVAAKQAVTFCSDNNGINTFFSRLGDLAIVAKKIFIVVITILAILACIPMAYREIWRWRTQQQRALLLQKHAFDPMDVIYIASRPYSTTIGLKAANKFKTTKRQILTRWTVAYATSVPALFVLALGVAGLFSCLCQYILLKSVEKEVPALAGEVGAFADTIVHSLNNASEAWAVSANAVINSTNTKVNNDVFGWAVNATTAVNNTLNGFMGQINQVINDTFGGTILYEPVSGTIKCLLGLKVDSIEKGLTWVHDNAHVTFPEFRNDTLSLGAAASLTNSTSAESYLASPGSVAADDITAAVVKLTNKMTEAIQDEAMISGVLIGIWVFFVLVGVGCALFNMVGRDKTRAEGGSIGYTGDNRAPISPRSPNRNNTGLFPKFGGPVSSVRPTDSEFEPDTWVSGGLGAEKEKVGHAGHRTVGKIFRKGHERSSSYGFVDGSEKR
jgi:HAMP domain-containing protein